MLELINIKKRRRNSQIIDPIFRRGWIRAGRPMLVTSAGAHFYLHRVFVLNAKIAMKDNQYFALSASA